MEVNTVQRYNGVLGHYHTNNQSIEVQIMRKFLREQHIRALSINPEASELFSPLNISDSGSLLESSCDDNDRILKLRSIAEYDRLQSDYSINDLVKVLPPMFRKVLTTSEAFKLQAVYAYIYPNINIIHFSQFYTSAKKCIMAGELFSTLSVITAFWPVESFTTIDRELQVGQIKRILKHTMIVSENNNNIHKTHVFCEVHWYMQHSHKGHYGSSAIVCTPITYATSSCSFIPIQRISHQCSYAKLNVTIPPHHSCEQIIVVVPVKSTFYL